MRILSTYNSVMNKDSEKSSRQRNSGIGGKQYIDITDPAMEEQLNQRKLKI